MKKPSDLAVAILLKRMKGKKAPADDAEEPDDTDTEDDGDDEPIAPSAEVAAFKKLRLAVASEDDAKGAAALKQFLQACGAYDGDDEE
jgi:hypothetical protein